MQIVFFGIISSASAWVALQFAPARPDRAIPRAFFVSIGCGRMGRRHFGGNFVTNSNRRRLPALLLLGVCLAPAFACAQEITNPDPNNTMAASLRRAQAQAPKEIGRDQLEIEQRPPLPFVPFEMVDVVTGAPIDPDTELELPDGKRIMASQYFRELNEVERGLCEMGYSLRGDWKSIVIQKSRLQGEPLERSLRGVRAAVDESKPFRLRSEREFDAAMAPQPPENGVQAITLLRPNVGALQGLRPERQGNKIQDTPTQRPESTATEAMTQITPRPKPKPTLVESSQEYPFEIGDPNVFSAKVYGRLGMTGAEDLMKLDGDASARVSIFGVGADLARLDARVRAPKVGDMSGRLTLDVLPFGTVYDLKLDGASVKKSGETTRGIDIPFADFRVMLGPVPVRVKAGASGSVGMRYFTGLNPASAVAEFSPIVRSKAYISAAADYYVAGVGAAAELTLVNYDLAMYGELRLWMQTPEGGTKPEWGIRQRYEISNKLTMLSGNAYAFAYIYYPTCCIPPWDKKEWRWEMFNWEGFTPVDGTLVDETLWTPLGVSAP
jgi:hypothetical protein